MKIRTRILVFALIAVLVVAAFPLVTAASHSWGNYHWARTSNPFTLRLGDNLSNSWKPYLKTTSTDWSKSNVLNTTIVAGRAKGKNCRPETGNIEICNAAYGNNGWLGIAQIWASGSHITQGAVKLNDTYFNTSTYNTSAWKNLVMCQEVGHIFGLDHQDEDFNNRPMGTCMDYSNDPEPNQHPNSHDYQMLEQIYAHLDSTSTVGAMPAEVARGGSNNPGEWGRLVKSDGHGALYERDFGNGHKIFTFVIWVE